jgi:hypothetical protein
VPAFTRGLFLDKSWTQSFFSPSLLLPLLRPAWRWGCSTCGTGSVDMVIDHTYEPLVYLTWVVDDFGNEVRLPMGWETGFRNFPIVRAHDFYESGEVH